MKAFPASGLYKKLNNKIKDSDKILVLGVGSELRGDDVCGIEVTRLLQHAFCDKRWGDFVKIVIGGTAPENFTSQIKRFKPSHIIVIDSAQLNKKPGAIAVLSDADIGNFSFSTHRMPINMLIDYLRRSLISEIIIIGIQPNSIIEGGPVSDEVKKAIRLVSQELKRLFEDIFDKKDSGNKGKDKDY